MFKFYLMTNSNPMTTISFAGLTIAPHEARGAALSISSELKSFDDWPSSNRGWSIKKL